jgi:hypothetical protein
MRSYASSVLVAIAVATLPGGHPRAENYVSLNDKVSCRLVNPSVLAWEYNWKPQPKRLESVDGLYCNATGKAEKRIDYSALGGSTELNDDVLAVYFTSKDYGNIEITLGDFKFVDSGPVGQVKDVLVSTSYANSFLQFLAR